MVIVIIIFTICFAGYIKNDVFTIKKYSRQRLVGFHVRMLNILKMKSIKAKILTFLDIGWEWILYVICEPFDSSFRHSRTLLMVVNTFTVFFWVHVLNIVLNMSLIWSLLSMLVTIPLLILVNEMFLITRGDIWLSFSFVEPCNWVKANAFGFDKFIKIYRIVLMVKCVISN